MPALFCIVMETVKTAGQNDAAINQKLITEENQAAFMAACKNGDCETVKLLIGKNGVDINKEDDFQETPLYIACENGHLEVVKLLIKNGADINKADENQATPLYIVCQNGHLGVVKLLLKNNETATPRRTLLEMSCRKKNIEIARFLLILDPMLFFTTRDPKGFLRNNFKSFEFLPQNKMFIVLITLFVFSTFFHSTFQIQIQ